MAEIEKEEVEFPACATLWQGNCIRWQHLIFLFIYIVQLYKEDWGILHMLGCQAVALPSTKQIEGILLKNRRKQEFAEKIGKNRNLMPCTLDTTICVWVHVT